MADLSETDEYEGEEIVKFNPIGVRNLIFAKYLLLVCSS